MGDLINLANKREEVDVALATELGAFVNAVAKAFEIQFPGGSLTKVQFTSYDGHTHQTWVFDLSGETTEVLWLEPK